MKKYFNQTYLPEAIRCLNHSLFFLETKNFYKLLFIFKNIVVLRKSMLSYVFNEDFDIIISEHKDLILDIDNVHLNILSFISLALYEYENSFYLKRLENGLIEENEEFHTYFDNFLIQIKEKEFNKFMIKILENSEEE